MIISEDIFAILKIVWESVFSLHKQINVNLASLETHQLFSLK